MKKLSRLIQSKFIYYIFLLLAHIGLVWLLPYFPTQDGPSHIYNLVILHDLINGGREWGNFFSYQLHAAPNLGFNLLAYPLLHFFPPFVVEKIFVSTYIVLMGVSVPVFLRTFDKPCLPLSYFVFPVIFNFTLLMGFYSYVITVPLFLMAFSFAWKIRNKSIITKFICLNVSGLIVFYFHLIPFALFLLSLIAITICCSVGYKNKVIDLFKLSMIMFPSLLNLFYYLIQGGNSSLPDLSYLLSLSRNIELMRYLLLFSMVSFSSWQMLPASICIYIYMFLLVMPFYLSLKAINKAQLKISDVPASYKTLICMSSLLLLIYLFAPTTFGEGSLINQRFPWVIFLITLPLLLNTDTMLSKNIYTSVIAGAAVICFIFNVAILWRQSEKVGVFLSGLNTGLPKGAFVMTYKTKRSELYRVDVLLHAVSYYGIYKGVVDIGNYEADSNYSCIMHFKKTLPVFPAQDVIAFEPKTIIWPDYPSIQYLLGWEIDSNDRNELGSHFHIIWENGAFNLWERTI